MGFMASRIFKGRTIALGVAVGWTALAFGTLTALPSPASANEVYYRASLATPVGAEGQNVISGVLWACKGNACIGTKGRSRPVIECTRLARKHGPIAEFSAAGTALESEDLARCNA